VSTEAKINFFISILLWVPEPLRTHHAVCRDSGR
jgi:hypothetical protein